jgi:hypothetical protein
MFRQPITTVAHTLDRGQAIGISFAEGFVDSLSIPLSEADASAQERDCTMDFNSGLIGVAIVVVSGALALTVAILSALMPMPLAAQLEGVFAHTFELAATAIVGVIAGYGSRFWRRQ